MTDTQEAPQEFKPVDYLAGTRKGREEVCAKIETVEAEIAELQEKLATQKTLLKTLKHTRTQLSGTLGLRSDGSQLAPRKPKAPEGPSLLDAIDEDDPDEQTSA